MRRVSLLVALFLLAGAGILPGQDRKTFDPIDLVNLKSVHDPQISPDGSLIAYVVETPVSAGERRNSQIWLVPSDGGIPARAFVTGGVSNSSPRWSPDGSTLAFLTDRANSSAKNRTFQFSMIGAEERKDIAPAETKPGSPEEKPAKPVNQIWLISLHGGEAIQLTAIPGGVKKFKWSKDAKQLAFVRSDQDIKEEAERKQRKEDHIEVDANYKFDRLWVYDLGSRQARLVTKENMNIDDFDWAP